MHVAQRVAIASSVLFVFAACKSGENARKSAPEDASFPVWELSTKSADARNYIEEGERLNDRGRFLEAIRAFRHAVAADSAYGYAYLRVAQSGQSLDEYNVNLQRAIAYRSSANEIERTLIDMENLNFQGNRDAAIAMAESLTVKQPSNPRAWFVLATQYLGANRVADERKAFEKTVALAPKYGLGYEALAQDYTFAEPRDFAKAKQYIDISQKIWPNEPFTWDYTGDLYRAQGMLDQAAEAYGKEITLAPTDPEGYQQRGHAYTFLGKGDLARADYDNSARNGVENYPAIAAGLRAYIPAYEGNFKESIRQLEELYSALDGMNIPDKEGSKIATAQSISFLANALGDFAVADSANRRLAELSRVSIKRVNKPEFERGTEAYIAGIEGFTAADRGDTVLAKQKAAHMIELVAPLKNPTKEYMAHMVLARAALHVKQYDVVLKELALGNPQNVYGWYERALALEGLGRKEEAKAEFQKVSTYNFNGDNYAACRFKAIEKLRSMQ